MPCTDIATPRHAQAMSLSLQVMPTAPANHVRYRYFPNSLELEFLFSQRVPIWRGVLSQIVDTNEKPQVQSKAPNAFP